MNIHFWGVRGSLPNTLNTIDWSLHFQKLMKEFLNSGFSTVEQIDQFIQSKTIPEIGGYGTATTCVEVQDQDQSIIIDAGSGIKNLNDFYLKSGRLAQQNEFHILLTHFHFDHIIGIPFFNPHFMVGKKIKYYSVQSEASDIIKQMFQRPTFPVPFDSLQADIEFITLKPYEKTNINGFAVTAYQLDHPDACYGFRIEKNKKVFAHAVDHEAVRRTHQQLGLDAGLFQDADLLYFDAQYLETEMVEKKGWGHGTCDRGFEVSANFNIQQILFAHHDPSADLQKIRHQKNEAEKILKKNFDQLRLNQNFKWDFAYEGQMIRL